MFFSRGHRWVTSARLLADPRERSTGDEFGYAPAARFDGAARSVPTLGTPACDRFEFQIDTTARGGLGAGRHVQKIVHQEIRRDQLATLNILGPPHPELLLLRERS